MIWYFISIFFIAFDASCVGWSPWANWFCSSIPGAQSTPIRSILILNQTPPSVYSNDILRFSSSSYQFSFVTTGFWFDFGYWTVSYLLRNPALKRSPNVLFCRQRECRWLQFYCISDKWRLTAIHYFVYYSIFHLHQRFGKSFTVFDVSKDLLHASCSSCCCHLKLLVQGRSMA